MELKFTQEIKDRWLEALKSGNYIQGYGDLVYMNNGELNHIKNNKMLHCCIGVLGDIIPELDSNITDNQNVSCPYNFLNNAIDELTVDKLIRLNDFHHPQCVNRPIDYKDDYSNVIPFIEGLNTQ